jgi:hypothetical protein
MCLFAVIMSWSTVEVNRVLLTQGLELSIPRAYQYTKINKFIFYTLQRQLPTSRGIYPECWLPYTLHPAQTLDFRQV